MTKNLIIIVVLSFCLQGCITPAYDRGPPHRYIRDAQAHSNSSVTYFVSPHMSHYDLEWYVFDFDDNILRNDY